MTTRVAALYDVHGNLPALEAVLAEVERAEVDLLVSGGDVVAGPLPAECLALLEAAGAHCLRGNADREVVVEPANAAARWAADRLDAAARARIEAWPETLEVDVDGIGSVLFCHGSPRSDLELLTEATPEPAVAAALDVVAAALVVCGHTHHQFDRRAGGRRLVNAGSVGLPYEGRRGAFWLLLGPEVEHRRTDYDVEAAVPRLLATGHPVVADMLDSSLVDPVPKAEAVAFYESIRGA